MTRQPDTDAEEIVPKYNWKKHEAVLRKLCEQRRLAIRKENGAVLPVQEVKHSGKHAGAVTTTVIASNGSLYKVYSHKDMNRWRDCNAVASYDATFKLLHTPHSLNQTLPLL